MKRLYFLVLLLLFLPGCAKKAEAVPSQSLAVSVTLFDNENGILTLIHFQQEHQIQQILDRLRHLSLSQVPQPCTSGKTCKLIQIHCLNGKTHIYEWVDGQYLRKDKGHWVRLMK